MNRRLILMRHAQAGWGEPGSSDHDRPLTDRGLAQADAIGAWLSREGLCPDAILCSTATRATQTSLNVIQKCTAQPQLSLCHGLYLASADAILREVRRADSVNVLLIGHNPGIENFADMFSDGSGKPLGAGFSTATTAVFEIDAIDWPLVGFGMGRCVDVMQPDRAMKG